MNSKNGDTQSIAEHLEGVLNLANRNCPLETVRNLLNVIAVCHDAGKFGDDYFGYMQQVLKYKGNVRKQNVDHATAGGKIVDKITGENLLAELVSLVIYSHHGFYDCIDMGSGKSLFEERRKKDIDFEDIEERFFKTIDKKQFREWLKDAQKEVKSIYMRIGSFIEREKDENYGSKEFYLGMYVRLLLSILMDSDWTDTACFFQREPLPERITQEKTQTIWEESIYHFEEYMRNFKKTKEESSLDVYRNEISDLCYEASKTAKNLYRLTVPTGAGKTFSSLRFALNHARKYHKKHIYYVAPYNSILEQNAQDIRSAVGNADFVLEHHCNVCHEDEEEERIYQKLTENWESAIVVTTAVQMLNTLFTSQKSSIRRMYNLCNSVIIFDEVQAFPVRGTELFNQAVNFLTEFCNVTVVLCSATQPSLAKLQENNLFHCTEMAGMTKKYADVFKRVEFEDKTNLIPGGMQPEDLSVFAFQAYRKYGSVLIIVNTKSCARKVYEALRQACEENCALYHLSTYMCPENRSDELEKMKKDLKNKKGTICVSTQLVEAGVNISFGCVIRSLAGLDSIIQAAGRCNRHKEMEAGKVYIIKMAQNVEQLERLEDIQRARMASEKFLYYFKENPEDFEGALDSESSVKAYYEEYYIESTKYPSRVVEGATLEELLGKNPCGCRQYGRYYHRKIKQHLRQAFKTVGEEYQVIQEDEKVTVVVPYDNTAEREIEKLEDRYATLAEKKKALRVLQRYSVGIHENLVKNLGEALYRIQEVEVYVLNIDYYDKQLGILETPKNRFLDFM